MCNINRKDGVNMNNELTDDQLKSAVDLVEYVGQHVELKKKGKEWSGLCPFHNEKSPSFSVNENKQVYSCFGCGASGSIIDFIMGIYGLDTHGAFNHLKAHLGLAEGKTVEVVRRLSPNQVAAENIINSAELVSISVVDGEIPDACAALADFGIFLPSCYSVDKYLVVPLRSRKAVECVWYYAQGGRGVLSNLSLHDGYSIVGLYDDYSQHLYLCDDYIDAIYLHKISGGNNLIVYAPHINYTMETIKRDFPQREIRLAISNTNHGQKLLETFVGRYVMPDEEGYFCERDRKQTVNGVRNAK